MGKHNSENRSLKASALLLLLLCAVTIDKASADADTWQTTVMPQSFFQFYSGSEERKYLTSIGAYLSADYLESTTLAFAYNYSFLKFDSDADLSEHLYYLSGRHNYFLDALPGKLELRLDAYLGMQTLGYSSGSQPTVVSGGGKGKKNDTVTTIPGANNWIEEDTDINAYQAQAAFANYAKTFYMDLGYAQSEYDGTTTTKTEQWTPTLGFGINDSYDWLQLRAYRIDVEDEANVYDGGYNSLEGKYTHWYEESDNHQLEFVQFSILSGKRLLAIDSDAAVIYSTTDMQTGSLTLSAQWRLSTRSKFLLLGNYGQFKNEALNDEYQSLLFYINLQQQW